MTLAPDTDQAPEFRCIHCPRLLHADELNRYACRVCEDRAGEQLRDFPTVDKNKPGFYDRLAAALRPGSTPTAAGHVTGATRSAPLPVALQPLSLRGPGGIVDMLLGIESRWRNALPGWDQAPARGGYEASLNGCVPVLVNAVGWACDSYPEVDADLKLINSLHQQADAVVNGVRESRVPIGCCPTVNDQQVACGEKLRVSPFANEIRCTGCGTRWDRGEWLRLGAMLQGFPMPVTAVA